MRLGFERPTPGQGIAALLLALGAFAYPFVGHWAIERFGVTPTALALLASAGIGMVLRIAAERRAVRTLLQNAGALLLLGLAAASGERTWLQLFPALVNVYLAVIFVGDTLWAVFASYARPLLAKYASLRNRIAGAFLVAAGIGLALARR